MARIAGVNLPGHKRVEIGLRSIFGVGPSRSKQICAHAHIPDSRRVRDLTDAEVVTIRNFIDEQYRVEGDLSREISGNIERLKRLGCYRGLRHRKNLPTRGQRTHTNARTRRGKAKPIAGKKK